LSHENIFTPADVPPTPKAHPASGGRKAALSAPSGLQMGVISDDIDRVMAERLKVFRVEVRHAEKGGITVFELLIE
jgi:hypothetical protein